MKSPGIWISIVIVIALLFSIPILAYPWDSKSPGGEESFSRPAIKNRSEVLAIAQELAPNDVLQNMSFANLTLVLDTAYIKAGFTHPYDAAAEVMIEWTLYAWNDGWTTRDQLSSIYRKTDTSYVEVETNLPVPEYDYYLLECKDKIQNADGLWEQLNTSESRYSKIAPKNGIWERTGEVTSVSAVLHTYLTEKHPFDATDPETLRVPPMAGYAQFVVYSDPDLKEKVTQSGFYPVDDYVQFGDEWRRVNYNFRWTVSDLEPDTTYYYLLETMSSDGLDMRVASNINSFRTSPAKDSNQAVSFVVTHCLDAYNTAYEDPLEAAERGLKVFDSMKTFDDRLPDFIVMQGDTVYYDGGEAYSPDVGLYPYSSYIRRWLYWYSTYQYKNLMLFFQHIPGYWMVDDHDYWGNNINEYVPDGWYIFRNTNPTPGEYGTTGETSVNYYNDNPYHTSEGDGSKYWRTIRWGQHLEIFIEEGRNHREEDANLIWGIEQREWLEQQVLASEATFKIIAATTPLLGPVVPDDYDPSVIPDKHANQKFRGETELFLNHIRNVENVFIVAGDRHYKYHSVINSENYPDLSHFTEFSSGSAAAPPHAIPGGIPESDLATLLFSDGDGGPGASAGYLRVDILPVENGAEIVFRLIRVTQDLDNDVIYEQSFTSFVPAPTPTPTPTPTGPNITPPNIHIPLVVTGY